MLGYLDERLKSALLERNPNDIVECINDIFWNNGLSTYLSKTSKQYPGSDNLWSSMKLRAELLKDKDETECQKASELSCQSKEFEHNTEHNTDINISSDQTIIDLLQIYQ